MIQGAGKKNRIKGRVISRRQTSVAVVKPLRGQWLPTHCHQPPIPLTHLVGLKRNWEI